MQIQMPGTRLFELFGTQVYAQGSYLFILLLLTWRDITMAPQLALVTAFVITLSLLVHEFGHVFAAKTNGHGSIVVLGGMGAFTMPSGQSRGWRQIWLSVAGPLFGLCLWAISWFIFMPPDAAEMGHRLNVESIFSPGRVYTSQWGPLLQYMWLRFCWINLWWSLLNLLPIYPLDGGHVLMEALRMNMRSVKAQRISATVGLLLGGGIAFFCLTQLGRPFGGVIAGFLAYQNWERLRQLN